MKTPSVSTLALNEPITAQFLVLSKEVRQKKGTNESYLSLQLGDRTGEIDAKMWDNVAEVADTFERDDFVKVKGLCQLYQNRSQLTIHKLRKLEDHEVDFADYFPCSQRDSDEMFRELKGIIGGFRNPHLRQLLEAVFNDTKLATLYRTAPAAKTIHHACRGGLIEHVLSLCSLGRMMAGHYRDIDLDLLLAGAILHDIGKVQELTYDRSFNYSADGQLLGHIVIGLRIFHEHVTRVPDFPPKLRSLVEHMIVSHHGTLEFGSPKVPLFLEAMLLHHLDNLDSKMETMRVAAKRDIHSESEFTGWIASLERVVLRKELYLAGKPAAVVVPAPQVVVVPAAAVPPPATVAPATAVATPTPNPAPVPVVSPVRPAPPVQATPAPTAPAQLPIPAMPAAHATPSAPAMPLDRSASPSVPETPVPPSRTGLSQTGPSQPAPPKTPAREHKPVTNTLFGEKLQAVLGHRDS